MADRGRQPNDVVDERDPHLVEEGDPQYNVIAVSFEDDASAYNAMTRLKELDSQRRVGVQEAVVVVRREDGQVVEKDKIEAMALPSTAAGALVGLLIGILGGPFGMLVGSASGVFIGSLFDVEDITETESALSAISSSLKPGRTALLGVLAEESPEVVDSAMSEFGGTVLRRAEADVEAEVATAEKAARKAKAQARKELLRSHREHDKAELNARLEELRGKLRSGAKTPA